LSPHIDQIYIPHPPLFIFCGWTIAATSLTCDNGKGLSIFYIEHIMLCSPKRTFTLSNILYVPHITKPFLSVQKFYCDNNVYFEFHANVFYVKYLTTKVVLLSSQSTDCLHVLSESSHTTIPQAY